MLLLVYEQCGKNGGRSRMDVQLPMRDGSQLTSPGQYQMMTSISSMMKKYGSAARLTKPISRLMLLESVWFSHQSM